MFVFTLNSVFTRWGKGQHRIVAEKPNDVWTVDFKGYWYTKNKKEKVNPLTIRDEKARVIFSVKAVDKGDTMNVKAEFIRVLRNTGCRVIYAVITVLRSAARGICGV